MMIFLSITISLCLLFGPRLAVAAQGICVPDELTINAVSGKVMAHLVQGESPISDATVSLLKDQYKGRMIAETATDASGNYSFKDIKPGKYVLKVTSPNLAAFYVRVRVVQKKSSKDLTPEREIVVLMGAAFNKPCAGSFAELREKKGG